MQFPTFDLSKTCHYISFCFQAKAEQEKRERGERAYTAWMKVNSRRHVEIDWYGRLEEQSTH